MTATPTSEHKARVSLTDLPFTILLVCTVAENGLGETFSVHVRDCGISVPKKTKKDVARKVTANANALVTLALKQALNNSEVAAVLAQTKDS